MWVGGRIQARLTLRPLAPPILTPLEESPPFLLPLPSPFLLPRPLFSSPPPTLLCLFPLPHPSPVSSLTFPLLFSSSLLAPFPSPRLLCFLPAQAHCLP